jgi:hypothetical protein
MSSYKPILRGNFDDEGLPGRGGGSHALARLGGENN